MMDNQQKNELKRLFTYTSKNALKKKQETKVETEIKENDKFYSLQSYQNPTVSNKGQVRAFTNHRIPNMVRKCILYGSKFH